MRLKPTTLSAATLLVWAVLLWTTAEAAEVKWHAYSPGLKLGQEQGKNILINFYADWCGYCRKMDQETFTDEDVAAYLDKNFITIKVNADKAKDLAASYQVQGLPMLWFVEPSGERIAAQPGFVTAKQLMTILKFIQTNAYKQMSFKDFLDKGLERQ